MALDCDGNVKIKLSVLRGTDYIARTKYHAYISHPTETKIFIKEPLKSFKKSSKLLKIY